MALVHARILCESFAFIVSAILLAPMPERAAGPGAARVALPTIPRMSYYKHHIFFCLNHRDKDEDSCSKHDAQSGFDHCKKKIKGAGLAGPGGVRVNKAGCLDRCAGGPVAVVYPEGTWYTYVDKDDIDEIVESHLVNGQVVERLLLPPNVGR
jgi:(2Fe-2S) ferredoxin